MNIEFVSLEEIDVAYRDCRKHKANTYGALQYAMDSEINNYDLWEELNSQTYKLGLNRTFIVTRPKLREVFCAPFRDRIVHHLLYNRFKDILENEMIDDAYACQKGKGTQYGVKRIKQHIEEITQNYTRKAWILKCDLKGFFMSIDKQRMVVMALEISNF